MQHIEMHSKHVVKIQYCPGFIRKKFLLSVDLSFSKKMVIDYRSKFYAYSFLQVPSPSM